MQVYKCFGRITFPQNTETKNQMRKMSKKKTDRTNGWSKCVFWFFFIDHRKTLIFCFVSLIFAKQTQASRIWATKCRLLFQIYPAGFCLYVFCLVFTFDWKRYGVVLCYSSRVDQIKLKHRTVYTTCSNPIKSSQCFYRQKIAKSIRSFFLSCACLSTVRPSKNSLIEIETFVWLMQVVLKIWNKIPIAKLSN